MNGKLGHVSQRESLVLGNSRSVRISEKKLPDGTQYHQEATHEEVGTNARSTVSTCSSDAHESKG